MNKATILLSFDIEEFDMPFEYGGSIRFEEQLSVSQKGLKRILNVLDTYNCKATFFSTYIFAANSLPLIQRIIQSGHELASHTYYHSKFSLEDLKKSKLALETLSKTEIKGLRMPRMLQVPTADVIRAGYRYNSSINPTYLPGKYNNLHLPRTYFQESTLLQIPTSVSPLLRIPLFWLSFHHFPLAFYQKLVQKTAEKDGYVNLYFHPWEFSDINEKSYRLPLYIRRNTDKKMHTRFEKFLQWIQKKDYQTHTFTTYFANRFIK